MKLLLVEDEVKTANSLKQGLEENGYRVDVAMDGESGLKLSLNNVYDLIVCDIILPKLNGLEICKQNREQNKTTPILLLTALSSVDEKVTGFEAGADDYLVKPFAFRELLVRINSLLKRSQHQNISNSVLEFSDLKLDLESKTAIREGQNIELTRREFALIKYLIENNNKVISKKAIAEDVWNINFDTGTNTIEVYVNYLRNKIDKPFAKKLIHTSHGSGYILKEQ